MSGLEERWNQQGVSFAVEPSKIKLRTADVKKASTYSKLKKYNDAHDPKNGRFTFKNGGGVAVGVAGHNGVTTKQEDADYMAAVKAGDMKKAQQMVIDTAKRVGAQTFANPDTTAYSIRRKAAPTETVKAYKTFFVDDDGNPSALFVEGTNRLPVGVWLDAKDAYHFQAENGKMYTPSRKNPNSDGSGKTGASIKIPNDEVRQQLIEQGFLPEGSTAKNVTALAYRPGWHAGDLPFFPQGGKKGNPKYNESGEENKQYDPSKPTTNYANVHRRNQVVFEVEMAADVDYTKGTAIKSGANKGKTKYTDMQEMPTDGYYKFATNPMTNANDLGSWYISGSMKIKRALSQEECDKILADNGFKAQEWEGGKMSLDKLNYNPKKTDLGSKLLDPVTYDDNGDIIPLSERFSSSNDVRKSMATSYEELRKHNPYHDTKKRNASAKKYKDFHIAKADEDQRLVFGWASVARTADGQIVKDWQEDTIEPEEMEKAAYEYVLKFRATGERHNPALRNKGRLVESVVLTKEKQAAMGIPEGYVDEAWWVGFYIDDDKAWEGIKKGEYEMFSIEGQGKREKLEKQKPLTYSELKKFNAYHDRLGRFTTANGAASFTITTKNPLMQGAADKAKEREKARTSGGERIAAVEKELKGMLRDGAEVNLKGVDPELAEGITKQVKTVLDRYPNMKQAIGGFVANDATDEMFADNEKAMACYSSNSTRIHLNRAFFKDKAVLEEAYAKSVERKFHPEGTNADSIVVHEMGHAIDRYVSFMTIEQRRFFWGGERVSSRLWNNDIKKGKKNGDPLTGKMITDGLSGYASSNPAEYIAEGFSEYICSPNPRPMAKSIGRRLETYIKKVEKVRD